MTNERVAENGRPRRTSGRRRSQRPHPSRQENRHSQHIHRNLRTMVRNARVFVHDAALSLTHGVIKNVNRSRRKRPMRRADVTP